MRTRFAPSPTGFLHVGGLRTALYAYLMARQGNGKFLVRIEDTDQERSVEGAVENMLRTLQWAGLDPDEGVTLEKGMIVQKGSRGPYIQSERLELYRKYAEQLLESGAAYYAFDAKEELDAMRDDLLRSGNPAPRYDATVRMRMKNSLSLPEEEVRAKLQNGEPYVIRMKTDPNRSVTFRDDIRGEVTFQGHTVDDQVLLKSDGFPTYHLAHVVDDHLMDIDIVIRGEEWLSSLPKHLLLFEAFGWNVPRYAHVPLLLNKDRSKLSKRQNDVSAEDYIARGYLPEALLNFLALLGWNPGTTQEVFSLPELIEQFSLERVQKAGAIFDLEKLDWLQGQWIRKFSAEEFSARIRPIVSGVYAAAAGDQQFAQKASLIQERITFFHEAPAMLAFFYEEPRISIELLANRKQKITKEMLPEILKILIETLERIPQEKWNEENLKAEIEKRAAAKLRAAPQVPAAGAAPLKERDAHVEESAGLPLTIGQLLWPLRAALTGLPFSPGAYEVAVALDRATTLQRLKKACTLFRG